MKQTIFSSLILFMVLLFWNPVMGQKQTVGSGLPGTVWRIVKSHNLIDTTGRVMYFYKDYDFEGLQADGSLFNLGKYRVINDYTFVTVHVGAESANLYNYYIKNDTLKFNGYYLSSSFPKEGTKIDFEAIDEVWVKANDLMSEDLLSDELGIKFNADLVFSTALARSAQEGKLIFMDCYTSWCGPCKYLTSRVFTKKMAGDFFNKNFINLSFDMESPEGKLIAARYHIMGYPTLLFLNSKGEVVQTSLGSCGVNQLIDLGKTALEKKSASVYKDKAKK